MTNQEKLENHYDKVEAAVLEENETDDYYEGIKKRLLKYEKEMREELAAIRELLTKKEDK